MPVARLTKLIQIVNSPKSSYLATKYNIIDSIMITELARIFLSSKGVINVLKRVSPSITPVDIAIMRVKGKTIVENIRTSFNTTGWKDLNRFRTIVRNGIRITNA